MKNKHDYEVIQGETFLVYNVWSDLDGNPNDLSTWTGSLYIYDRGDNLLAEVVLTLNASGEIEGSAATDAWPVGTYKYFMRLTSGSGSIVDLLEGNVCVE